MLLLDTDVLSASRRPDKAAPQFAAWVEDINSRDMFLSTISILEIKIGALRIARRDTAQAAILERWISENVLRRFEGRILSVDADVALRCASLHFPDPRPERDAMIAAMALEHRLTVVTRNVRDFGQMGVPLVNPWEVHSA
jgi:predicted nucleic acid-binding protein